MKANYTAECNHNEELVAKTIDFAGKDMKRKENIAATVADNFTKEEIKMMTKQGDLIVTHGKKVTGKKNADGAHRDRAPDEPAKIYLDDDADTTAITHEFVHHLRKEDRTRTGTSKTVYKVNKDGYVIKDSKTSEMKFAEECAVIGETEIRTKEPTTRPNINLFSVERQPITDDEIKKEVVQRERETMRTKADYIKPNERVPIFKTQVPKDGILADGTNLRGKRARIMFERNFKRSFLGDAYKRKKGNRKNDGDLPKDKDGDEQVK